MVLEKPFSKVLFKHLGLPFYRVIFRSLKNSFSFLCIFNKSLCLVVIISCITAHGKHGAQSFAWPLAGANGFPLVVLSPLSRQEAGGTFTTNTCCREGVPQVMGGCLLHLLGFGGKAS